MRTSNGILAILGLVLLAIVVFAYIDNERSTPGEKISESIGEVTEEIQDEIDDNTSN
ncbi:MAG TPA: hypothetical protein PLO23_00930 [Alphaproteobacteria bacterium]|nr:hypothetical protein [Alphaproteobacteria bacterium]